MQVQNPLDPIPKPHDIPEHYYGRLAKSSEIKDSEKSDISLARLAFNFNFNQHFLLGVPI